MVHLNRLTHAFQHDSAASASGLPSSGGEVRESSPLFIGTYATYQYVYMQLYQLACSSPMRQRWGGRPSPPSHPASPSNPRITIGYAAGAAGAAGVISCIRWAEQPGRRNANSASGMSFRLAQVPLERVAPALEQLAPLQTQGASCFANPISRTHRLSWN